MKSIIMQRLIVLIIVLLASVARTTAFCADIVVDSYTKASLPAAGTAGRLARVTDDVRGLWMDGGSQWFGLFGAVVNVREFGAIGNGTTNDTTAIHAARDAAGINGSLYFPPGTYGTVGLTANLAGQKWELAQGATIKLLNASNATVLTISANDITIHGGTIDGNKANQTFTSHGIVAANVSGIRGEGMRIKDCLGAGVRYGSVTKSDVIDSQIDNCKEHGVKIWYACSDINIHGVRVFRTDGLAGGTGIESDGGTIKNNANNNFRIHVVDCISSGHTWGGIFYAGTYDSTIVGCTAENNGDIGIDLEITDHVTVSGNTARNNANYGIAGFQDADFCTFTGNVARSNGVNYYLAVNSLNTSFVGNTSVGAINNGFYIVESPRTVIQGNTIRTSGMSGIEVIVSNLCVIQGNIIEENNYHGIYLNDSSDCSITGNVTLNNGQSVGTFAGIQLTGATASARNVVVGNISTDNQGTKTQDRGIGAINASDINNIILGNNVSGNSAAGVYSTYLGNNFIENYGQDAVIARHLSGTASWDPPSINNGAATSITVTIPNATVGDTVAVGFSTPVPGKALLVGAVTAADTVTVTLANHTGSALNLASGTLRADVWRH